jgi:hypothetical protein
MSLEKMDKNSKPHHDDFVMFLRETLRVNATITTHFIHTLPTIFKSCASVFPGLPHRFADGISY